MKRILLCLLSFIGVASINSAAIVRFQFYGTDLSVKAKKNGLPMIETNDTINVEKALMAIRKNHIFDSTIKDCLSLKEKLQLNDWGYFVMLDELSKSYVNTYAKSPALSTIIMAYLCSRSGFDVVLGITVDKKMALFYKSKDAVYDTQHVRYNDKIYFLYKKRSEKNELELKIISLKSIDKSRLKKLDFSLKRVPLLKKDMVDGARHNAPNVQGWDFKVSVNKNLINFYNDYPMMVEKPSYVVLLAKVAEMPLSEEVKVQLYPSIKKMMEGNDQLSNVNNLLSWIQMGFDYAVDVKVWGTERPFYPEESLYYPYTDAEDRCALFARIVTDLLGLKTVYLYSDKVNHLAIGIHFKDKDVKGDFVMYNGDKYVICDPSYYFAKVGQSMNSWVTGIVCPIFP